MVNAITVNEIGKRYRIGAKAKRADTFSGKIKNIIKYPLNNFKELSRLSRFDKEDDNTVFWALKDINFEVKEGEVLGIIGHNGAGKSTLLKILSKITEPTKGEININGRIASLLEVGTGFHPELTGRDNIYMNGTIMGMRKKEIDSKLDEIIAFSGVEQHIDTPVKFYSSGMKVRLGFSVAAHLEPEILVIDEVLAVGDYDFQKKCLGKMESVAKGGRTVLFVSHDMNAVEKLCSRGIVLQKGGVCFDGHIGDAIKEYASKLDLIDEVKFDLDNAPGNEYAKLLKARIIDENLNTAGRIDMRKKVGIEITYHDFKSYTINTAIIHLKNSRGDVILASNEFNHAEWELYHSDSGVIKATCWIPENFLQPGMYSILVAAGNYGPNVVHFKEDNLLSFEIINVLTGETASKNFVGNWPGLIRPILQWDLKK